MPTLALIDGNSIAYRAFYALPEDLATRSGQVTNAVFGFTRMLIRLIKDHHPEALAVAWDVSRQTFRTESYPEYKANRSKAPDHFSSQLPLIDEVLQALHITQLRQEGYEADDIIASLTRKAVADGWDVLIVTGDRDAYFWATHGGAELDLMVNWQGRRYGFEFKYGDAPSMTKSMHTALHDLKLERLFVIHPGKDSYVMNDQTEAVAFTNLRARLAEAGIGGEP